MTDKSKCGRPTSKPSPAESSDRRTKPRVESKCGEVPRADPDSGSLGSSNEHQPEALEKGEGMAAHVQAGAGVVWDVGSAVRADEEQRNTEEVEEGDQWGLGWLIEPFIKWQAWKRRTGRSETKRRRVVSTGSRFHLGVFFLVGIVICVSLAFLGRFFYDSLGKKPLEERKVDQVAGGESLRTISAIPVASWDLSVGKGNLISGHETWPFDNKTRIRFKILNVPEPELSQVRLLLKEDQDFGSWEYRSGEFGDGTVIDVAGFSGGGDRTFYLVFSKLPGDARQFTARFPSARVEAFKAE